MQTTGEQERPSRRLVADDGTSYRVVEAWRAVEGPSLCYFLPLTGGSPDDDDRRDLRAALDAEGGLEELDEASLLTLREEATALTGTERRFRAPDGRLWLAQNYGPVWAEDGAAEGMTGIRFTSLEGPLERLEGTGGHLGSLGEGELRDAWRRATGDPDRD